jgi:hypothetical protein
VPERARCIDCQAATFAKPVTGTPPATTIIIIGGACQNPQGVEHDAGRRRLFPRFGQLLDHKRALTGIHLLVGLLDHLNLHVDVLAEFETG